jgi:hypothetical protein
MWQTLRRPKPDYVSGGITWDIESTPPDSFQDVDRLAASSCEDAQIVIWGRTWHYGTGYILDPVLAIRTPKDEARALRLDWNATLGSAPAISVELPAKTLPFAPVVLPDNVLAELNDPAFLTLYDRQTCQFIVDQYVGDYFQADEFTIKGHQDVALVSHRAGKSPDQGCVRLPGLRLQRSNIVRYSGGLVAFFRGEWAYARDLLYSVANDEKERKSVRASALIYIGVASERLGEDPVPSIERAYALNMLEPQGVKYLCVAHLRIAARSGIDDATRASHLQKIRAILAERRTLFPSHDPWVESLEQVLLR